MLMAVAKINLFIVIIAKMKRQLFLRRPKMSNPKYNYAVVRTYTRTRLIHAEDKNDLLELISEGVIDEELSLSEEYDEYTFYKINSNGEEMVELLEKDIVNLEENENE
jgi:hypothetical protein